MIQGCWWTIPRWLQRGAGQPYTEEDISTHSCTGQDEVWDGSKPCLWNWWNGWGLPNFVSSKWHCQIQPASVRRFSFSTIPGCPLFAHLLFLMVCWWNTFCWERAGRPCVILVYSLKLCLMVLMTEILSHVMQGEGDLIVHVGKLGYHVSHVQVRLLSSAILFILGPVVAISY